MVKVFEMLVFCFVLFLCEKYRIKKFLSKVYMFILHHFYQVLSYLFIFKLFIFNSVNII